MPRKSTSPHQTSQSDSQTPEVQKSHIKEIFTSAPLSVKIVVIAAFSTLATIETTFWVNVGWRYFSSSPADEDDAGAESLSSVVDSELRKHILVGQAYERYRGPEFKDKD